MSNDSILDEVVEEVVPYTDTRPILRDARGRFASASVDEAGESVSDSGEPIQILDRSPEEIFFTAHHRHPEEFIDPFYDARMNTDFGTSELSATEETPELLETPEEEGDGTVWCYISRECFNDDEFLEPGDLEDCDVEYKIVDGITYFPRSDLPSVFDFCCEEDFFNEDIDDISDLIVMELTPRIAGEESDSADDSMVEVADHWDGYHKNKIKEMVTLMLSPIVKTPIEVSVPHGSHRPPVSDEKFRIFIWATPDGFKRKDMAPTHLWGIPVGCRNGGYDPSTVGEVIYDEGMNPAAELVGNNLYILHDIVHNGTANELGIFERILEEAAKILIDGHDIFSEEYEERMKLIKRKLYIKNCKDGVSGRIEHLQNDIVEYDNKIKNAQENVTCWIKDKRLASATIEGLQKDGGKTAEKAALDYDRILEMKEFTKIEVTSSGVMATTDKMYVEYEGFKYYVGNYRITLPFRKNASVKIHNLDPECKKYTDRHGMYLFHPHVKSGGDPCLGNIGIGVYKLLGECQYALLLRMLLNFLKSANPAGWYDSIKLWERVSK
jgi:hypothetical protein